MKSAFLLATTAVALMFTVACNRPETSTGNPGANTAQTYVPNHSINHNAMRLVPGQYSQPISLDTANWMINSYLNSINYPYQDTTIRALSFDADTVRAYLRDTSITTLKLVLAHQLEYLHGDANRFGKNVGMRPGALTIILVGLNDAGMVVRNSSGGVYEHAFPCPQNCGIEPDAYLH